MFIIFDFIFVMMFFTVVMTAAMRLVMVVVFFCMAVGVPVAVTLLSLCELFLFYGVAQIVHEIYNGHIGIYGFF